MADDPAAQLAALKTAKASGVLSVRHGDTQTTFRNLAELDSIIASLTAQIDGLAGQAAKARGVRLRYPRQVTKGL